LNKPLLILFIIIGSIAFGQNLVPNPSFEQYDTCPTAVSSIGDYQINHCTNWYAPSPGTSDYFNSCALVGVNVPNAAFGYQFPYDGQGFLGVMLLIQEGEPSYFEHVQSQLLSSLVQGSKYKFSFNVNLASGSDFAVGSFGAWFTNYAATSSSYQPIFNSLPQIQNTTGFIADTIGWTKIEGEFTASGGEEFITIGFYTDTLVPDTLRNNPEAVPIAIYSYYYIDGLVLTEVLEEIVVPNVITPNSDNVNDIFELPFSHSKVSILNRWGNLVWENTGMQFWNGKSQDGNDVSDGVYFYVIETESKTYKGFVQVVR
jgi:gliding motility-associated-like protein